MCRDQRNISKRQGILVVVTGPSGAGKTTLVKELLRQQPLCVPIVTSATYTTRMPRDGEVHGQDYHFVTREEFNRLKERGFFLETSGLYDACYGSARQDIDNKIAEGKVVTLVLDRSGVEQTVQQRSDAVVVRIIPPTYEELERRLRRRNTSDEKNVQLRLALARAEEKSELEKPLANFTIENAEFNDSVEQLKCIFSSLLTCQTHDLREF